MEYHIPKRQSVGKEGLKEELMNNGHFEKGKWIPKPHYEPFKVMKGRFDEETKKWILDVHPEKGDEYFSTHTYLWYVFDGYGWVFDKSKYGDTL